ncbi:MAG: HD domain-containing protein [Candidatus Paceibacterota bacterium]
MTQNHLSDEYILSEIEKLKYLYGLNKVIRFNLTRKEEWQTQSVAEHVANMIYLAYYFREHEDPAKKLDFDKVIRLIMAHDLGEIETGDILTVVKNDNDEKAEKEAIRRVKKKSPKFIADEIDALYDEFEDPKSDEGKYARAVDKFEGQLFWLEKEKVKAVLQAHKAAGVETRIVHPIHMKKVFTMLDSYKFVAMKRFLEVVEQKKYSYGVIE